MTDIAYEFLGRKYTGGGLDENERRLEYEEYYRIECVQDFPAFVALLNPTGRLVHELPAFRIRSSSVKRISDPMPDGSVTITVHVISTSRRDMFETDIFDNPVTENTPPWHLRVEDFRIASAAQEESVKCIWPGINDVTSYGALRSVFVSKDYPVPFLNSAGEPLDAVVSRGLSQMSFSYNLKTINPNATWKYSFKTNRFPVVICGLDIPERAALIQTIAMERKIDRNADGSVRWDYYKVAVQFLLDPESFNKDYHNLGTRIKTENGIARIWTWNCGTEFGTLDDYYRSNYADGEEIPDPVYLSPDGSTVTGFRPNGTQIPIYLNGCVFEPIDFNFLNLPRVR